MNKYSKSRKSHLKSTLSYTTEEYFDDEANSVIEKEIMRLSNDFHENRGRIGIISRYSAVKMINSIIKNNNELFEKLSDHVSNDLNLLFEVKDPTINNDNIVRKKKAANGLKLKYSIKKIYHWMQRLGIFRTHGIFSIDKLYELETEDLKSLARSHKSAVSLNNDNSTVASIVEAPVSEKDGVRLFDDIDGNNHTTDGSGVEQLNNSSPDKNDNCNVGDEGAAHVLTESSLREHTKALGSADPVKQASPSQSSFVDRLRGTATRFRAETSDGSNEEGAVRKQSAKVLQKDLETADEDSEYGGVEEEEPQVGGGTSLASLGLSPSHSSSSLGSSSKQGGGKGSIGKSSKSKAGGLVGGTINFMDKVASSMSSTWEKISTTLGLAKPEKVETRRRLTPHERRNEHIEKSFIELATKLDKLRMELRVELSRLRHRSGGGEQMQEDNVTPQMEALDRVEKALKALKRSLFMRENVFYIIILDTRGCSKSPYATTGSSSPGSVGDKLTTTMSSDALSPLSPTKARVPLVIDEKYVLVIDPSRVDETADKHKASFDVIFFQPLHLRSETFSEVLTVIKALSREGEMPLSMPTTKLLAVTGSVLAADLNDSLNMLPNNMSVAFQKRPALAYAQHAGTVSPSKCTPHWYYTNYESPAFGGYVDESLL